MNTAPIAAAAAQLARQAPPPTPAQQAAIARFGAAARTAQGTKRDAGKPAA
jgi:hypothetical protein